MAITKLWSVKSRLDSSIKYIQNKDKTENYLLISVFNCNKDSAYIEMNETKELFEKESRKNGVVAYHLVQSFKDLETTPEIAHKCGM